MTPFFGICPLEKTVTFQREMKQRNIPFFVFQLEDLYYDDGTFKFFSGCSVKLDDLDCVITRRVISPLRINLEQFSFSSLFYKTLEERIPVINSLKSHLISVDKLETHFLLKKNGLPVPNTWVLPGGRYPDELGIEKGSYVVKPVFGSKGHGLVKITDQVTLKGLADRYFHHNELFYLQEFIDSRQNNDYHDLRLFVVNNQVIASMKRVSKGNWLTNIAYKAIPEPFKPDDEMQELAIKAASLCGTFYAGVDLIQSREGTVYILEVNSFPGWEGLQRVNKVKIPAAIIDAILENYF
ncbi:MAG: ATP-grasp domain-containing protein [Candidatus Hodarchaeales archaeon]|jgi:RimK family alpha-L-glutamate ligase